jgi:hypothetical protein
VDAHLVPGGDFFVLYYASGDINLNKIHKSAVTGEIVDVREVTRYERTNEGGLPGEWSRLLTETSYRCLALVLMGLFDWDL